MTPERSDRALRRFIGEMAWVLGGLKKMVMAIAITSVVASSIAVASVITSATGHGVDIETGVSFSFLSGLSGLARFGFFFFLGVALSLAGERGGCVV